MIQQDFIDVGPILSAVGDEFLPERDDFYHLMNGKGCIYGVRTYE